MTETSGLASDLLLKSPFGFIKIFTVWLQEKDKTGLD